MKEILVARKALEASLIISALATSVRTICKRLVEGGDGVAGSVAGTTRITTRSGCMKSATAEPSLRNSGQET